MYSMLRNTFTFLFLNHHILTESLSSTSISSKFEGNANSMINFDIFESAFVENNSGGDHEYPMYQMMDHMGQKYECKVAAKDDGKTSTPKMMKSVVLRDMSFKLEPLEGLCASLQLDIWMYEYCVHTSVQRIMIDGSTLESLGRFSRTYTTIENHANTEAIITSLMEEYKQGYLCQGTGQTLVSLKCCDGVSTKDSGTRAHIMYLSRVKEINGCSFLLEVCLSTLCDIEMPKNLSALSLLNHAFSGQCLGFYYEGWWTYEFCFDTGIRQFHLEEFDGHKTRIETEYSIGLYDPHIQTMTDNEMVVVNSNGQPNYIKVEYTNGSPCEFFTGGPEEWNSVRGQPRSSSVQFQCGPTNAFESVVEDYTCHYNLVVTSPVLCQHPALAETKPVINEMKCLLSL